jgi:hypothetical protein
MAEPIISDLALRTRFSILNKPIRIRARAGSFPY